jgi:D-xylose transport system substrate-binding protein
MDAGIGGERSRSLRGRRTARRGIALVGTLAIAASGCGANQDTAATGAAPPDGTAKLGTVGVILPETATSARWEAFDKPFLEQALERQGFAADVRNAQGDAQKFSALADGMINAGVKALVLASPDAKVGAAVQVKARQAGIPTIDYDRLNVGGSADYYVTFDAQAVGRLQGQALADALADRRGAEVIEIEGSAGEYNAVHFHRGQQQVLEPLYDDGALRRVATKWSDGWDNQKGGVNFEQTLTTNGGKVDGVVAANDGLAGAVITVLKKNRLNGKVPVTGQDATPDGLKAILRGDQFMTVFKPIKLQADATAKLVAAVARGETGQADAIATGRVDDPETGRPIKSLLLKPLKVTRDDVKTVVEQGYVEAAELCTGALQSTCRELGIA